MKDLLVFLDLFERFRHRRGVQRDAGLAILFGMVVGGVVVLVFVIAVWLIGRM